MLNINMLTYFVFLNNSKLKNFTQNGSNILIKWSCSIVVINYVEIEFGGP